MTESPGQSRLDACPLSPETGTSMFTIASQLITQLVGLIEGPTGKFKSRIAVLRTIHEAWTSNREVTVMIEDSDPDQLGDHHDTSIGMSGYADRALDYRDENEILATGSTEMVTEDSPGGLLNTIEVFEDLGNRRARVNIRKIDIKTEGKAVLDDKWEEEADIHEEKEQLLCKKCGNEFLLGEGSPDRPFACPCCQLGSNQHDTIQHVAPINGGKSEATACPVTIKSAVQNSNGLFECHVCSKGFKTRTHLKVHFRIHTKEKPYSCKYCDKCFRTSSNRNKHQTIHLRKHPARDCQTSEGEPEQNASPSMPPPVAASDSCGTLNSPTESSKRYLCDVCNVSFSSEASLGLHRRRHQFTCRTCGIVLPTRSDLIQHKKGHVHSPSKLPARDKNMSTNSMMAIRKKYVNLSKTKGAKRSKYHCNTKQYRCEVCLKNFISFSHLNTHKLIHSGVRPFGCLLCPQKFTQRSHLVDHWKKVHKKEVFNCEYCRRVFLNSDELMEHHQFKHESYGFPLTRMIPVKPTFEQKKPFTCPDCSKGFVRWGHLKRHMECVHKDKVHVQFQCGHCNKRFFNKAKFESHKMTHLSQSPVKKSNPKVREVRKIPSKIGTAQKTKMLYECPHCKRKLTRKDSLVEHIRTHTKEKPLVCQECGMAFSHRVTLCYHRKAHHPTSFMCRFCKELFPTKKGLDEHLQNQHGMDTSNPAVEDSRLEQAVEAPSPQSKAFHRCKYCSELFGTHRRLVNHEKLHTGNKPIWECHICKKICSSFGFLEKHMTVHDKKIIPHTHIQRLAAKKVKVARQKRAVMALRCQYCDMIFQNRSQLTVHERSHTEETQFSCVFCQVTLKTKTALDHHQRTKHALAVAGSAWPDSGVVPAEHTTSSNHFSGDQSTTLTRSPVRQVFNANTSPRSRLNRGEGSPVRLSASNRSGSPRSSSLGTSFNYQLTFESKRSSPQAVSTSSQASPGRPSLPVGSPSKSSRFPSRERASSLSDSDTNRKILQCKISGCGSLFISEEDLAKHEKQHEQVLNKTNNQKAKTGKASSVSPGAPLTGSKKKKKSTPDKNLVEPQLVYTSEMPFPCECGRFFNSKHSLHCHQRFHRESAQEINDS